MGKDDVPAWIPSERFEEALLYAVRTHAHQARKGGTVPYLAHLFGVASLVMEDGGSEDETIAALLHDAAEDQGRQERLDDIRSRFGDQVAELVRECSESLEEPRPPWHQRKAAYVAHLATASPGALRVSIADKIHNGRSMAADHALVGDDLWKRFHAPRDDQAAYYQQLVDAFKRAGTRPGPLGIFESLVSELFPK